MLSLRRAITRWRYFTRYAAIADAMLCHMFYAIYAVC